MRQLKGGRTKETRREKRDRRIEYAKAREQFVTYGLPILIVVLILIVAYVYVNSRPKTYHA